MSIMDEVTDDRNHDDRKKGRVLIEKLKINNKSKTYKKREQNNHTMKSQTKVDVTDKVTPRIKRTPEKLGIRSDSPGMDLSVFEPRGKRKCVIQSEAKKQKNGWLNEDFDEEDDDEDDDDDEEEEEIDEKEDIEVIKDKPKKKIVRRKRKSMKTKTLPEDSVTEHTQPEESALPSTKTARCYVFSTGMANRAGHAVHKGLYKSITAFHHAQKWDTPYLNAEVHCRPFHPDLEEEIEEKDLSGGFEIPLVKEEKDTDVPVSRVEIKEEYHKLVSTNVERTLTVDSWQKEKLIQTAKELNRLSNLNQKESESNPPVTKSLTPDKTDSASDSSPQTVPKFLEQRFVEEKHSPKTVSALVLNSNLNKIDETIRKKDLNSPPQLVPSIHHRESSDSKSSSYPADITNIKEQLRYNSPKTYPTESQSPSHYHRPSVENVTRNHYAPQKDMIENPVRPTVLSMAGTASNDTVRSTLDMAEKSLKESRTEYKGVPILPRDIHPSLFLSRHSSQPYNAGYDVRPSITNSLLSSRLHGLYSPNAAHNLPPNSGMPPHSVSPFHPAHDVHRQRYPFPVKSSYRELDHKSSFDDVESMKKYEQMHSPFSSIQPSSRPSSLPVLPSSKRSDHPSSKSFSVESLTKSHNGNRNESHSSNEPSPLHTTLREQPRALPEHFKERLQNDRARFPNSINGLKRSLDEQLSSHIMERVQQDKLYLDHLRTDGLLHDKDRLHQGNDRLLHEKDRLHAKDRLLHDKERHLHGSDRLLREKELLLHGNDRLLYEKERCMIEKDMLHRSRYTLQDPRSSLRLPHYLPRSMTNGNAVADIHSPSHFPHGYTPHVQRSHPYSFPNR